MPHNLSKFARKFSLVGLTSAAILISGTAYANKYITSAEKYLQENDVQAAVIELKNAIQNSPKDAQPRLMLGEIYLQSGNFIGAEKELARALSLEGDKVKVVPLLARTLNNLGRYADIIDLVDNTKIDNSYANTELLALKAIAELHLKRTSDAEYTLQMAKDSSFDSLYTKLGQAQLNAAKNEIPEALKIVDQILDNTDNNSDVWLLKGHLETAVKDFENATESYTKAYELSPDATYYIIYIARSLVMAGHYDKADPYVSTILKLSPNHPLSNELKAIILYSKEDYIKAKEHANRAINNGADNLAVSLISAISAYKLKLIEQANSRLAQIYDRLPKGHFAKQLYISTQLQLGYVDEAIELMNQLELDSDKDSSFLSKASMQLSKLGRDEEALALAQKASETGGTGSELMLGLIKLQENDDSGFEDINSAIADQPESRKIQLSLALYYLKLGKFDAAEATADTWLNKNQDDREALLLKAMVYQAKKENSKAEKLYRNILKQDPENTGVLTPLSQVLANQKQWKEAYKHAYKACSLTPGNRAAFAVLVVSAKQLNQFNDVINLVDDQINTAPESISLKHQKASLLALDKKAGEAINLLESLPDDQKVADTWELLGNIYYSQKRFIDAERSYAQWLTLSPTDVDAHIRNIHISEMTNKIRSGVIQADNAAKIFPNDIRFPLMKAALLLKSGDTDASQRVINNLSTTAKNSLYVKKIQGLIYLSKQNFNSAIKIFKEIYEMSPGLVPANQLATAYVSNQQADKAVKFLKQVLKEHPDKAKALQLKLANIQSRMQPEEAINQYLTIVKREPNNIMALNNLAYVYLNKGDIEKANEYAEKAYRLAPKIVAINDTYGYCQLKSGNTDNAVKILKTAYDYSDNHPEIALHYAESLIASKQIDKAKNILSRVITEEPELVILKGHLEKELSHNL